MSKHIPLTQDQFAVVDDEDYDRLSQWKWYFHHKGYAVRTDNKARKVIPMHRAITGAPDGISVDHINGNKLDNRRSNLRLCTHNQNCYNRTKMGRTSQYKGVTWVKRCNKWQAQTMFNNKPIYLGRFVSEIDAAKAYDRAARENFGEFARLNFPESE